MSKKKNKINNPLSVIPTKSLIITFVMILLFIACGFGLGYGVRGCVDQRENQALTAYAEASAYSDNDYTVITFSTPIVRNTDGYLISPKITFLNHSLTVYPTGRFEPVVFSTLTPTVDLSIPTVNWADNNRLGSSLSYAALIDPSSQPASISSSFEAVEFSTFSIVPLTYSVRASLSGSLTDNWELLRIEGFYQAEIDIDQLSYIGLRAYYSNGAFITLCVYWSGTDFILDTYDSLRLIYPSFVFYNTSETGLTAQAYERGKLAGMADTEDLVREARLDGYNNGRAEGEDIGYQRGLDTSLEDISPFNVIVSGVNSFLRTEILPGVQLTIILSVTFGILLLGFAIKIFLGG